MELRLLGPVEVAGTNGPLDSGPPQQRAVLAALAVDAGRLVPMPVLADRVWGEDQPDAARQAIYTHVARIRDLLGRADGGAALVRRSGGYTLEVDPQRVDVHRFQRLVRQARDARGTEAERAALFREALGLWRGEPLIGLPGSWADRMRVRWRQQRVDAVVGWARAELRLGAATELVEPLAELATEHPLVEPLIAVLLRALAAAGRTAEALDWYAGTRGRLAAELGTDPGAELRHLHQAILRGALDPAVTEPIEPPVTPAQLPPDVPGFAGRDDQLARLDAILGATDRPPAVVIAAVSGTAGVGKTTLAVHWAHRVRPEFPDGQLYLNLRGFDPGGTPVPSSDAVRVLLDALGVPPHRLPSSVDAQAGLYRSLLATRRMLVLLDNARDAEQVRPLLPAVPGCLALVTSRDRLAGLVTVEGARPLTVDLLTVGEARELLAQRLGADRLAAEPRAVDDIVAHCAGLPLALAIVATRAAEHPGFALAVLADELRRARGGLDAFDGSDILAVFSWSYRLLTAPAARLFRLLGLHPGPDITVPAAASLAGRPVGETRRLVGELARAHLVEEHAPGRYACHDLLRAYASELVGASDGDGERRDAVRRLLDHYVHSAHHADQYLHRSLDPVPLDPPGAGVVPETVADAAGAWAWLTAERPVLLGAVALAVERGFDRQVGQLAAGLGQFLDKQGRRDDWLATQQLALAAAERQADRRGQARAHRVLGYACAMMDRDEQAHAHFETAQRLYRQIDDQTGQAHTHINVCFVLERRGDHQSALEQARHAHRLFQATGNVAGQAYALNNQGWCHAELGEHHAALACCREALDLFEQTGNRHGQADTLDSLGYAYHQLGDHDEAAAHFRGAIALYGDLGEDANEADTLVHLGEVQLAGGDPDAARLAWQRALAILDELDHPDADAVRTRLAQEARSASPG